MRACVCVNKRLLVDYETPVVQGADEVTSTSDEIKQRVTIVL